MSNEVTLIYDVGDDDDGYPSWTFYDKNGNIIVSFNQPKMKEAFLEGMKYARNMSKQ